MPVKPVRFLVMLLLIVGLGGTALAGCVVLLVPAGSGLSDVTSFDSVLPEMDRPAQRSYVLDRYGNRMTTLFVDQDRQPVTLADVPEQLIDAVIAIEDRDFYEHNGVDIGAVVRAAFHNVDTGEIEQGGSTITMQLVKNTMSDPKKRNLKTKIREAVLARRLENELTKNEILERYLNVVYLGNGAYGIKAASERYFNKEDPRQLTLGEASLLAGLIRAPETLNPITHPDRAARRRALVLQEMIELHTITEREAAVARAERLPTTATSPLQARRDYFVDEVVWRLINEDEDVEGDVAESLGATQPARYNAVFRGGLQIETTFDPGLQLIAAAAVNTTIPESEFTAAMAVIDNANGAVRAMVAGRNFEQSQYNLVTEATRQTGSAFKAITLATALDSGYSPEDRVSGSGITLPRPGEDWKLSCGGGTMSFESAISRSNNCAFARTIYSLGPGDEGGDGARKVIDMASRLGIDTTEFQPVPSLTLGTQLTSPLDMAEAFSVFANDGVHRQPVFVSRIVGPDGDVIYEANTSGEPVITPNRARTETQMLEGVIKSGTGTAARLSRPAAGKTGTTDDNADAWFIGYTPQYTASVWMGHPEGRVPMNNVGGIRVQGGTYPARIWKAFMEPVHADLPVIEFIPPDEEQWPTRQSITEEGRQYSRHGTSRVVDTTTVPPDATTVPPPVDATTVPPPPDTTPAPAPNPEPPPAPVQPAAPPPVP
jgi:penicillin-binding protein 1A